MDSFIRSYFLKTERNAGIAFLAIISKPKTRTGITITNVIARLPPIRKAMITAKTSISGARTARRVTIINAICTFVISVVSRVTRDGVEN